MPPAHLPGVVPRSAGQKMDATEENRHTSARTLRRWAAGAAPTASREQHRARAQGGSSRSYRRSRGHRLSGDSDCHASLHRTVVVQVPGIHRC